MGYKAAVQILRQAENLKYEVLRKSDLLSDSQIWIQQQKLQGIYHQVLILDLEYALDEKVEQDLWNIGFKNHISELQELTRNKKNVRRSEYQALLTWCLETASGFYLTLLHELCNTYDIDLSFRRRGNVYGESNILPEANLPQLSSCLYICQYCLVHLGDIARYKSQRKQAESFYKNAILVSPTSGHPYNQLALLQASQGDKLSTVFYYIRGITVKNPFPASATNLLSTLSSTIDKESPLEKIQTKITSNEFIQIFLNTLAFLHTGTDLPQAEFGVKTLNTTMTALVATQSFTSEKLIKITAINLYALKHVNNSPNEELTEDEALVKHYVLELLAGSLSAFLVPVHTLKNDESLLEYYALPAVKILMYWIKNEPDVLKSPVFTNRLQIWPSLCKLLNNVQAQLMKIDLTAYNNAPLPEDRDLQGFRPLAKNLRELNFKEDHIEKKMGDLLRVQRITNFGSFISELDVNGSKLLRKTVEGETVVFEPGCIQPDPTKDLLEEIKFFNISDSPSAVVKTTSERRGGILKPQGSLEKSREERELLSLGDSNLTLEPNTVILNNAKKEATKFKRTKQNVALQSIIKKLEENNKQVKFNVVEDDSSPDKLGFESKPAPATNQPFNAQLRTQSFNQNHPAMPVPSSNYDYLNSLRNVTKAPIGVPFHKTDVPPPNPQIPPPNQFPIAQPSQSLFNNSATPSNFSVLFNTNAQQRLGVVQPPYQNIPYQAPPAPGHFKMDEVGAWWGTTPKPAPQNFARADNFKVNYPFGSNLPYMQQPKVEFNKAPNQAGDNFSSPWTNFGSRMNFLEPGMSFDSNGSGSMRQAMLKESNNITSGARAPTESNFMQSAPNYSLFNANSWSPSLVGQLQLRTEPDTALGHLSQHSLFTSQEPQSLAQLLEQQQSHKNDL